MLWNADLVPWLCWIFPTVGAIASLVLAKVNRRVRDLTVVLLSFLGLLMATFMIPDLFNYTFADRQAFWFSLPSGKSLGLGMLIDPLSIILANVVAFLGLLILVYSLKYMEDDPGLGRYWFFMSLFVGSMLLVVLADNFILLFVGWKIVGLCSFGLIGYYYGDEREHWIGGPPPSPFQKPSRSGLKALLVTTFGDVALLAGIIILYLYSGTFNFMELYQTAGVWLAEMAKNPGILTLTSILILAGPFAKSAQFPFHEWLPEAMAGPTPVSALIHAATMVKAGVYLVARLLPMFFFAYWIANPAHPEALTFFIVTAVVGAFTGFLGATQAIVSLELKKALAYSTMSVIGYMMLALGVAGLSVDSLAGGVSSGIFHLVNHGIFKVVLFLCAGAVIHASHSIYMPEMGLSKQKMRFTWIFMWIAALALIGVPPLSGFWSKDEILVSSWESGQYALFSIGLATVVLTTIYVIRFMGMVFHPSKQGESGKPHGAEGEEASWLMLIPYGILAVLTVAIGLVGPWLGGFFHTVFERYYTESLGLVTLHGGSAVPADSAFSVASLEILVPAASVLMILIGAIPAYRLYISHKTQPQNLTDNHSTLRYLYKFLWNRWYIDAFYNKVFVSGVLSVRILLDRFVESTLDRILNVGVPSFFSGAYRSLRKIQTGVLSVNMLLLMAFLAVLVLLLLLMGSL